MSKSEDRTNRTDLPASRWARTVALTSAMSLALLVLPGLASASDASSVFSSSGLSDTALAPTASASPTGATITSDKADYGPGAWVYLTGAGWAPGESVRIVVNDDGGAYDEPWQRDVTVTADDAGNIADEFELPPWFVAAYTVTATGEQSGTATTSFTDEVTSTASVDRKDAYRNRTGVSFSFSVNVTAGDPARSLRITVPNNAYEFTACSTSRASWTATLNNGGQCIFESTGNAIAVGGSGTFSVTANISAGDDSLNSWNTIRVAPGGTYVNNQANAATPAATNSLAANAYAFEVTDAFVAASTATIGSACPSAPTPKTATAGTTRVIVVCGRPGTTQANLTPLSANSSLGGTMIGTAGTFKSASIAGSTAAPIVLANYGAPSPDSFTTITSAAGAGKAVEAKIGSSTSRTSPVTTLTGFEALAACTAASVATQPASQSITYGDNATFTATGNGDPAPTVQWQRSTDGGNSWDNLPGETNTTLTVTKPGVSQSGDRYRAVFTNTCNGTPTATSDAAILTVNPRQVTVTADAKSKTYGETDPALTYQITSGSLIAGDSFSGALTRDPGQDAGSYAIKRGTLALSGNYELSFIGANLTIGAATLFVDADDQSKTYGEDDPELAYSLRGFQFTDDAESAAVTGAADCSRAPGEDVGEYEITCAPGTLAIDAAEPQNYEFQAGDSADLTISAGTLFVDADDQTKTYGDDDPALTHSLRGFQFADDAESAGVTGAAVCERDPGEDVVEGGYEITCALGTLAIDAAEPQNYEFAVGKAGALTIDPATLFVDADPQSKTYGDDDPALTATLRGFRFTDDAESAGVTGAADCSRDPGEDVGEYQITCAPGTLGIDAAEPQNYEFETDNSAKLTIERKGLTGSFTAANKTYDGDPSATVTSRSLSGVVGSDDVSLTGGTATFADQNFGEDKTVTLAGATLAGDDAGNYTLDSVYTTTADITARDLTVTATGVDREYDGGTSATVDLSTDKLGADDVTPHYTSASFADKNVGIDKTVSVSGISISGDDVDAGNYNLLNTTEETEADITARPLTGSFTAASKVYDGNTSATVLTRTLAVVVPLDDVSLTGGTATFNNKYVGNGKPVTLTGAVLAGADNNNYSLAGVNTATANITAWSAQGHGFYEPVGVLDSVFVAAPDPAPATPGTTVWHTAKGGSTIPLKFNVYAETVERTSTSDISAFTQLRIPCAAGIPGDEVDLVTAGGTSLRYDTTGHQFIQNWKTPTASTETCYRATVTFADGSSLSAFFKLRK